MASEDRENMPLEEAVPLFIQECQMSEEQVRHIEIKTKGQHANASLKEQRNGRITASNFHTVSTNCQTLLKATRKGAKRPHYSQLVDDIVNGAHQDLSHLPQIAWGIKHEKDAIKAFMSDVASQHEGGLHGFKECVLFVKASYPHVAASPDGLFNCKYCGFPTIQVKCPHSARGNDVSESNVYKHVNFLQEFDGQPRLKRTHEYFTQVQVQMWVCNVQHSFFIVWTEGHQPLYDRIEFDQDFCNTVVNNLNIFYKFSTFCHVS